MGNVHNTLLLSHSQLILCIKVATTAHVFLNITTPPTYTYTAALGSMSAKQN